MHIKDFSDDTPGKLIPIQVGLELKEDDHAYIPKDLPPSWEFSTELWPLVAEAKQLIGVIEGIGRNLPNPTILLRPLVDREAINSSRLEGTYATAQELLLFELDQSEHKSSDSREVFNYRQALDFGTNSNLPLSLRLLKQMHQILMCNARGKDPTPGEFRRLQVAIGASRRFIPPPPQEVESCMNSMEGYMHSGVKSYDDLVDCFLVHYQFETIHPFNDGNGRVGRLLLALMMKERCGMTKPWLYLSEYFEKSRGEYTDLLYRVSQNNDWKSWIEFCLKGTIVQAKSTIHRCERLLAIRESFSEKLSDVGGSVRLSQIVDGVFDSPFVRIADLARRLVVSYPTAKKDVQRLAEAGILRELPDVTPSTYYAPEVYNVGYEQIDDL